MWELERGEAEGDILVMAACFPQSRSYTIHSVEVASVLGLCAVGCSRLQVLASFVLDLICILPLDLMHFARVDP